MVNADFMSNATDSEDEALSFNAKRDKEGKREIRKNPLRKRKTSTQESTLQVSSIPTAARQRLWLLEMGQEPVSQMLTSVTPLLKSP